MFYHIAPVIAWSREGRMPTPSERAHTYFLVAAGADPPLSPTEAPPHIDELRAMLEVDLRDGLAGGAGSNDRPRLLGWEHGPRFRTIHAELGATPQETNCVPTQVIYEEWGNPTFPAGTTLRLTSNVR
ncbi:hypothetical protein [Neoroseomonas lacus]|uniref:Uncharacterized protein n=1 Tax=Neoroseomonas lacus TaxID=287609 RepID=A0A917NPU3_9PROT|nr:hypothetical protein [Neoroseomonas lacus]GGJ13777.1 hypothetical protein GCM10011320_21230 [Neoroseomonas lacus]